MQNHIAQIKFQKDIGQVSRLLKDGWKKPEIMTLMNLTNEQFEKMFAIIKQANPLRKKG